MATIKEDVKTALRITHNNLDAEITRQITAAQADMLRAGVAAEVIQASGALVTQAIITYCQANMTEEEGLMDKYSRSYEIQVDGIRRATNVQ